MINLTYKFADDEWKLAYNRAKEDIERFFKSLEPEAIESILAVLERGYIIGKASQRTDIRITLGL